MTEERLEYLTQKREMVLEKLKPLCEYFGIKYDYEISDGKQTETLVLNGTRIGCTSNSFQGILDEVIGYIFINVWVHIHQCVGTRQKPWCVFDADTECNYKVLA